MAPPRHANRRVALALAAVCVWFGLSATAQIVADHRAVDQYRRIPEAYLQLVKKMWLNVPGESHSLGYRRGLQLLAEREPHFAASASESGQPAAATDRHLRVSRTTWGDLTRPTGWITDFGEEDWFTSEAAVQRTKAHLAYCHANRLPIDAFGFGWCWDMTSGNGPGGEADPVHRVRWAGASVGGPEGSRRWGIDADDALLTGNSVCMDTYLAATQQYADFCRDNGYPTKVFYTTGPVDGGSNTGENGYQRHLKHEHIRRHVQARADRILFDYADILCWADDGTQSLTTWRDHGGTLRSYPFIHDDNLRTLAGAPSADSGHIGQRGALRLAKALWWMLARTAGWDGAADRPVQVPVAASEGSTQLVNLSTRGLAGAGPQALIGGFVLAGPNGARKTLLIRGVGPTLARFGLASGQLLQKPRMTLYDASGNVLAVRRTQDLVSGGRLDPAVSEVGKRAGAFELDLWDGTTKGDTALAVELSPGLYSVSLVPDDDTPGGTTETAAGLVLLELYDVSRTDGARLVNLSTRARVEEGERRLIAGFALEGAGTRRLLVRGAGAALGGLGVAGCLSDASLELAGGDGRLIAGNDDWCVSAQADQIASLGASLGAFAFPVGGSDAALLCRVPAGLHTATLGPAAGIGAGAGGANGDAAKPGSGLCLVEIYETP